VIISVVVFINRKIFSNNNIGNSVPIRNFAFFVVLIIYQNYRAFQVWVIFIVVLRIKAINKFYQKYCKTADNEKFIKNFTILQDKFCDTINLINICFAPNFIMTFGHLFLHCVLIAFSTFHLIYSGSFIDEMFYYAGCLYMIAQGGFIVSIFYVTDFLARERNKTLRLIHKTEFLQRKNMKTLKSIQLCVLQLKHRQPEISCGLFTVDWKFLLNIISGTFALMIVLIQFDTDEIFDSLKT
jgi:hypothetical protein